MRRAAKIDEAHGPIVDALRKAGAFVQSLGLVGHGCPDLLVRYRGRWHILEVKNPLGPRGGSSGSTLRDDQITWWINAGMDPVIVRTVEEALKEIGAIT